MDQLPIHCLTFKIFLYSEILILEKLEKKFKKNYFKSPENRHHRIGSSSPNHHSIESTEQRISDALRQSAQR